MGRRTIKIKKTLNWKDLVTAFCEMDAKVPSSRIVEFLSAKGVHVTTQQVAAVKAHHTIKARV